VAFLPAKTFDLGDSHSLDPDLGQGIAHIVQPEWLYHCGYQLHQRSPVALV
jgi:hypothetical protein